MTEHDDSESNEDGPLPLVLRLGLASALIGIVVGGLLGFKHLHGIGSFFTTAKYGDYMLPSIALGAVAVCLAVMHIVKTGRYVRALGVFAVGGAAIATPFVLGAALLLVVLAIGYTIFSEM